MAPATCGRSFFVPRLCSPSPALNPSAHASTTSASDPITTQPAGLALPVPNHVEPCIAELIPRQLHQKHPRLTLDSETPPPSRPRPPVPLHQVGFAETIPTRPWFFNFSEATPETLARKDVLFGGMLSSAGAGAQFGGQVVNFEHGLAFVTVHGSGHMVPTFRPRAALQLIRHVVHNSSFAPPVPDLAAMTEIEFDRFVDTWVAGAKSAAYVQHP
eukprot:scaffold10240_cov107-Isochrysis_galbana.AAC.2